MMCHKLKLTYKKKLEDFILDIDVDLSLSRITALMGSSGAGKSTLLRLIAGLDAAEQAQASLGSYVLDDTEKKFKRATKDRNIAYVFQKPFLFPHWDVLKNLMFAYHRATEQQSSYSFEDLVSFLGIESLLKKKVQRLSGGEQQRIAIARSVMMRPQYMLLDEPVSALDEESKGRILSFLKGIHKDLKIGMLMVTHNSSDAQFLANDLFVMNKGRMKPSSVTSLFTKQ